MEQKHPISKKIFNNIVSNFLEDSEIAVKFKEKYTVRKNINDFENCYLNYCELNKSHKGFIGVKPL